MTCTNKWKGTCPADPGLANYTFYTDFTAGDSAFEFWNTTAGTVNSTSQGAAFIISEEGDSPTIQTAFYFFFGHVDVKMKIANGTGIISSIVFLSDDLDEIDWVCDRLLWKDVKVPHNWSFACRRALVHTTMKSRPTTLARITPQATTARPTPT